MGQRLTVYVSPGQKSKPAPKKKIEESNFTNDGNVVYYEVQRGDTLWDIARSKGITTDQLKALNRHMNPKGLKPGDKIIVGKAG